MNPSLRASTTNVSILSVAFIGLTGLAASLSLAGADLAIVRGTRAHLRAAPSMVAEVLGTVPKGERVLVLENTPTKNPQPDDPISWAKVRLPGSVKVWVFAQYVDAKSGTVTSPGLKVRSGPGKNFAAIGELEKGDDVEPIRTVEGWMQIEPPDDAVAYIAGNLIEITGPAPSARSAAAPPTRPPESLGAGGAGPPREAPPTQPLATAAPIPKLTQEPDQAPVRGPAVLPAELPAGLPPVATPSAVTSDAPPPVTSPVIFTPASTVASLPDRGISVAIPAPNTSPVEISTSVQYSQPKLVYDENRPRRVLREGLVALTGSPDAPTLHQLNSFRHREGVLDYLLIEDPKQIDLFKWRGKRVFIEGDEYRDRRWQTPVLKVRSIRAAF